MKPFIFILSLIIIISCSDRKSKVEVIQDKGWDYLDDKQITEAAIPTNENFEMELDSIFINLVKKWYGRNKQQHGWYPIYFTIYIGESGKVEKIKEKKMFPLSNLTPSNNPGYLKGFSMDSEVIREILPIVEKWSFTPANFIGKTVKYKKTFGSSYKIDLLTNDKFEVINSKFNFFSNFSQDYFMAVEKMPSPIGGVQGIQKKIHYPEIAKRTGIQGRVFVKAFIDENGIVTKTEIIKGLGGGCDDEAKNAVMETKFTPGRQRGKAVKTQVTVPILFKLDSKLSGKTSKIDNDHSEEYYKEQASKLIGDKMEQIFTKIKNKNLSQDEEKKFKQEMQKYSGKTAKEIVIMAKKKK